MKNITVEKLMRFLITLLGAGIGAALAALQSRTTINPDISPELCRRLVQEQKRPRMQLTPAGTGSKQQP